MIRERIILTGILIISTAVGGIFFAAGQLSTSNNPTQQTASVDINVLNVARPSGVFLSIQPGNYSAAFSFSPNQPAIHVNRAILTLNWDQHSLGHIGDKFSIMLNGNPPVLMTMDQFASNTVTLGANDVQMGANTINIGVIPVDRFATQLTTSYQLFEV